MLQQGCINNSGGGQIPPWSSHLFLGPFIKICWLLWDAPWRLSWCLSWLSTSGLVLSSLYAKSVYFWGEKREKERLCLEQCCTLQATCAVNILPPLFQPWRASSLFMLRRTIREPGVHLVTGRQFFTFQKGQEEWLIALPCARKGVGKGLHWILGEQVPTYPWDESMRESLPLWG